MYIKNTLFYSTVQLQGSGISCSSFCACNGDGMCKSPQTAQITDEEEPDAVFEHVE